MEANERYSFSSSGNWYRSLQGGQTRFKNQQNDIRAAGASDSYVTFLIKKWMKLFDQKGIQGKLCVHDIDRVLKATDEQTMEIWLQELSAKHNRSPEATREYITKSCFPIETFLRDGEEVKESLIKAMHLNNLCTSVTESSWFARYFWSFDYVVQGKIIQGKGQPRTKPYTKEENKENWKFTTTMKEYEEYVGHKPGFIMAPGIPHRIRPEGSTWPEPLESE